MKFNQAHRQFDLIWHALFIINMYSCFAISGWQLQRERESHMINTNNAHLICHIILNDTLNQFCIVFC